MTHELNTTTMLETQIGAWTVDGKAIEVTWHENKITKRGSLWVYVNDRVIAFGCSLEKAQAKVNEAAGQDIWTAKDPSPDFYIGEPAQLITDPSSPAYQYIASQIEIQGFDLAELASAHLHSSGMITYTIK